MIWDDKTISTVRELFDAACACTTTQAEADALLAACRADNENADANLGYVIGYADEDTRKRLYGLFRLNHPVFGRPV
jgi:hypothetical protein